MSNDDARANTIDVAASEVAKRIFLRKIAKDYPTQRLTRAKSEWKFRHGPCPT